MDVYKYIYIWLTTESMKDVAMVNGNRLISTDIFGKLWIIWEHLWDHDGNMMDCSWKVWFLEICGQTQRISTDIVLAERAISTK